MARGLSREAFTFGELQHWERLWGQQGVRVPFAMQPYRAVRVVVAPVRTAGDALLLRYSGGAFRPWLRRCTRQQAAAAPVCGRPPQLVDCARVWRRFFSPELIPLMEATRTDASGALVLPRSAQRACVTLPQPRQPGNETSA